MLRRMCGPKRKDVTERPIKLRNDGLRGLCPLPRISGVIQSGIMI
jgi:hypothetical protein